MHLSFYQWLSLCQLNVHSSSALMREEKCSFLCNTRHYSGKKSKVPLIENTWMIFWWFKWKNLATMWVCTFALFHFVRVHLAWEGRKELTFIGTCVSIFSSPSRHSSLRVCFFSSPMFSDLSSVFLICLCFHFSLSLSLSSTSTWLHAFASYLVDRGGESKQKWKKVSSSGDRWRK